MSEKLEYTHDEAMIAIQARINGDWDNPALVKLGELFPERARDVARILEAITSEYTGMEFQKEMEEADMVWEHPGYWVKYLKPDPTTGIEFQINIYYDHGDWTPHSLDEPCTTRKSTDDESVEELPFATVRDALKYIKEAGEPSVTAESWRQAQEAERAQKA